MVPLFRHFPIIPRLINSLPVLISSLIGEFDIQLRVKAVLSLPSISFRKNTNQRYTENSGTDRVHSSRRNKSGRQANNLPHPPPKRPPIKREEHPPPHRRSTPRRCRRLTQRSLDHHSPNSTPALLPLRTAPPEIRTHSHQARRAQLTGPPFSAGETAILDGCN
jgi:hypothetical protein